MRMDRIEYRDGLTNDFLMADLATVEAYMLSVYLVG